MLWDVDHTLTENSGVNKETYGLAFEMMTGRKPEYPARTDGRTEPEIMLDMLERHGIKPTQQYLDTMQTALESATAAKASDLRTRGFELPGARDTLAALQITEGVVQSVLTGNTMANAITKLSAFGLDAYIDFEVGGYGSDDIVRSNLVAIARERATVKYGIKFNDQTTVLIGDTPRDVRAGRDGGAYVIAVASGSDDMETLRREGADAVFPDLRDSQAVVRAVIAQLG